MRPEPLYGVNERSLLLTFMAVVPQQGLPKVEETPRPYALYYPTLD